VAEKHGITNGHAARMRFSRLKKTVKGHVPTPRPRKSKVSAKVPVKPPAKARKQSTQIEKVKPEILKKELDSETYSPHSRDSDTNMECSSISTPPETPARPIYKLESIEEGTPFSFDTTLTMHTLDSCTLDSSEYSSVRINPHVYRASSYETYSPGVFDHIQDPCEEYTMSDSHPSELSPIKSEFSDLLSMRQGMDFESDVEVKTEQTWDEY
jgi:hypothetical protein